MDPINTQFNNEEFNFAYPAGIENHYWTISRNLLLIEAIEKAGLRDEAILEIGCGKGLVVAALRAHQMTCWGAELADVPPIQEAFDYVKSNTDATTLDSIFRNQIKVLMFLDVLEHIEDPVKFLETVLLFYPNAAHLIITVPARQEIWSNYDVFYRHYRRYNLDMVNQTIRQLNFKVRFSSYIFHFLYGGARLKFLFSKGRPVKINAPRGFQKSLHRFIAWFLVMESRLLPRKLPGTSVFCVASKKS